MGRYAKFIGIGCGGLVALFVLLGIIGAIVGGGSSDTAGQPEEAQDSEWNQSEGEIYRGEDPSLYLRTFETEEDFQDFVDQEKAEAAAQAERQQQEAERAQQNAVEEQARAEQEQQELDDALEEADEAGVAPEPTPEAEEDAPGIATIRITGEQGQSFAGSYGNIDTTQSVDGTVPMEYEQEFETGFLSADIISVVMQKNTPGSWELGVEIEVDGEIVQQTSTTAEYGVAQVSYDTLE